MADLKALAKKKGIDGTTITELVKSRKLVDYIAELIVMTAVPFFKELVPKVACDLKKEKLKRLSDKTSIKEFLI